MNSKFIKLTTTLALTLSMINAASVSFLASDCYSCLSPNDPYNYYYCGADNQCYDSSSDICSSGLLSTGSQCKQISQFKSNACDTLSNVAAGNELTYDLTIGPQQGCSFNLQGENAYVTFVYDGNIEVYKKNGAEAEFVAVEKVLSTDKTVKDSTVSYINFGIANYDTFNEQAVRVVIFV